MMRAGGASGNNLIQAYTGSVGGGIWAGGVTRFYSTGSMTLSTNATIGTSSPTGTVDAVTIDTSGNLLVGTTSTTSVNAGIAIIPNASSSTVGYCRIGHLNALSGNGYIDFLYNNAIIGSITQSGTTNIAVNGTSDYRLKTNLREADGLNVLSQVHVYKFDWVDGREDNGFVAHELQSILPDLVLGEKDAVNEDGNPVYQQVNYLGVIPLLTKAIQELSAKNDALEARLAALESK